SAVRVFNKWPGYDDSILVCLQPCRSQVVSQYARMNPTHPNIVISITEIDESVLGHAADMLPNDRACLAELAGGKTRGHLVGHPLQTGAACFFEGFADMPAHFNRGCPRAAAVTEYVQPREIHFLYKRRADLELFISFTGEANDNITGDADM